MLGGAKPFGFEVRFVHEPLRSRKHFLITPNHKVLYSVRNIIPSMKIKDILRNIDHRSWPLPEGKWSYYQEWNNALFLHWNVDPNTLKKFIPSDLEIDLFEGEAWVSVVVFTMEKIRPRFLPAFDPISNFQEINIRTYVQYKGKAGVYFLSIEAEKLLSCLIAENLSKLPYRYSTIKRNENSIISKNLKTGDYFGVKFEVGDKLVSKSNIDIWLTERYALFQDYKHRINCYEIHHLEWPISKVTTSDLQVKYSRFDELLNNFPALTRYSSGVKVIAWARNWQNCELNQEK